MKSEPNFRDLNKTSEYGLDAIRTVEGLIQYENACSSKDECLQNIDELIMLQKKRNRFAKWWNGLISKLIIEYV